jgi:hypothetical protein
MPNWCNNFVEVAHDNPAEITRLAEAYKRGEFCDAVIPVPEVLKNPETTTSYGDPDKQAAADAIREEAVKATGYQSWYDFCTSRWGTKWDVGGDDGTLDVHPDGKLLTASFDSAWAPPVGVYEELVAQGFQVRAYYYEPGMCFAGVWDNGDDDCYQDWGDSQGAKDILPSDLDEFFAISESQAEYEEEERMDEELYRFVKEGEEKRNLELKTQ